MDKILSLSAIRKLISTKEDEVSNLSFEIHETENEIASLEEMARLMMLYGKDSGRLEDSQIAVSSESVLPFPSIPAPPPRAKTNKEAVVLALKLAADSWLTANEVQTRASKLKAKDIPMSIISPTLSALKNDGVIVRDGLKVALASRLNENGAANGLPQTAPETALAAQ